MALLDRPSAPQRDLPSARPGPGRPSRGRAWRRRPGLLGRVERRERRWNPGPDPDHGRPSRSLLVALVLASATLATLDLTGGGRALDPVRGVVADVVGPAESAGAAVVRPFTSLPGWVRSNSGLRQDIADLEDQNAELRAELNTAAYARNRLAEYDALTTAAGDLGYSLVPARVVGVGPAQSFSSTVTIDAGSEAGLSPDMTVVTGDGLVGRILRVSRTTATVLLIVDVDSTVGARVGDTMDLGFLHGRGVLGEDGRLDLELVDDTAVPHRADSVVTWGSTGGAPYVSGIPIGRVTHVYSSVRETSQRVVVEPYVDFGSLDVVGVVVPTGTTSDRGVISPGGSIGGARVSGEDQQ